MYEDDFQDVTGKSDGELGEADFRGVTSESVDEPMLSRNQLKVGKSFAETTTEVKSVQRFCLEREEIFFLESKDNQQKTYDNETGELS